LIYNTFSIRYFIDANKKQKAYTDQTNTNNLLLFFYDFLI